MERQLFIPSLKPRGDTGETGFLLKSIKKMMDGDLPAGAVGRNLPVSAGDTGLLPRPGRFHAPRSN